MDENLQSLIATTKQIVQETEKQLTQLRMDPDSDPELIRATEVNHDKAVELLETAMGKTKQAAATTDGSGVTLTRAQYRESLKKKG